MLGERSTTPACSCCSRRSACPTTASGFRSGSSVAGPVEPPRRGAGRDPAPRAGRQSGDGREGRQRFCHAPVVVAVVAVLDPEDRQIPEQERLLSAGCTCFALLRPRSRRLRGQLGHGVAGLRRGRARPAGPVREQRIAGFIHLGTPTAEVPSTTAGPRAADRPVAVNAAGERPRPACTAYLLDASLYVFAPGTRCRTNSATPTASRATRSGLRPVPAGSARTRAAALHRSGLRRSARQLFRND